MNLNTYIPDDKGLLVSCSRCGNKIRIPYRHAHRKGKCPGCGDPVYAIRDPFEIPAMDVFEALIGTASVPVLIDFWAAWCAPCRALAPELQKVASEMSGKMMVGKIDTEKQADLGIRFQIQSIPTLVAFSDGREIDRLSGVRPASAIISFMQERELL